MIIAVSVLAISLSFLLYHHPPNTWRSWLQQQAPTPRGGAPTKEQPDSSADVQEEAGHADTPSHGIEEGPEGSDSSESTPKVVASQPQNGAPVPTFTLQGDGDDADDPDEEEEEEDNMPPPSFPALNSAQRASAPSAPSKPTLMAPPPPPGAMAPPRPPSLMAPPQIRPSNLRALPTAAPIQGLRVPASGPLPNRGPVPQRTPGAGLGPPITGRAPTTPNARGKILLAPGHSPLDWANLQRSGKNLSGVNTLVRVTPSMLKQNNGRKGKPAWSSYQGKVYNITPYLPFHPGGEGELRRVAGKDGGKLFMEVHPWVNWENMLGDCLVGITVSEEQERAREDASRGSLEDMD